MTEHERNQTPEPRPDAGEQDNASPSRGMSRRRFGQAALGSVPVLMTLYSNPLRATSGSANGCSGSEWVGSANTSMDVETVRCGGRSPGHWGNQGNQGNQEANTLQPVTHEPWEVERFEDCFPGAPRFYEDPDGNEPLRLARAVSVSNHAVIYGSGGRPYQNQHLERKIVRFGTAAWLNWQHGYYNGRPNKDEIVGMVESALKGEYYRTAAGDISPEGVKYFLENTFD